MTDLVVVGAYNSELEAELVIAKLREAGIDAMARGDDLGGTLPSMQMASGGYEVLVGGEHEAAAREVLAAPEEE